jgi:hypothetical protein
VITGQAEPSLQCPDVEAVANILRLHSGLDVGRECGAGTRLSHDADVIGGFTHTLFAGFFQFDDGPPNLSPSVDLDNRPEYRFHDIERVPTDDGEQVGAGGRLLK